MGERAIVARYLVMSCLAVTAAEAYLSGWFGWWIVELRLAAFREKRPPSCCSL